MIFHTLWPPRPIAVWWAVVLWSSLMQRVSQSLSVTPACPSLRCYRAVTHAFNSRLSTTAATPSSPLNCPMRAARLANALRFINHSHTVVASAPHRLDLPMTSAFSSHPTASATAFSRSPVTSLPIDDSATYPFGPHIRLSGRQLFFLTPLSAASVNLSPVVPGHALVLTRRVVARMADMNAAEVADCFLLAQLVGRMLAARLGAHSLTYAVQDGREAGQSVPHVHVHVMPRRQGDFQRSDDIYGEMEKPHHSLTETEAKEGDGDGRSGAKPHMDARPDAAGEDRRRRTLEEMAAEALLWRQYMQETLKPSDTAPQS